MNMDSKNKSSNIVSSLGITNICKVFSIHDVQDALIKSGRSSIRKRVMSAELAMYYVIAMGLFMHVNLKEVLRCLLDGLRHINGNEFIKIIGKSGISQARSRLGYEPIKHLFDTQVKPIANIATVGAWYKHWRIVSIDGSTLDIPDEKIHREIFGDPTTFNDRFPFPQIRFVSLVEAGTHVLFGTEMADYRTSEIALGAKVLMNLDSSMLCIADRGFFSYALWKRAQSNGATLLWRTRKVIVLPVEKLLPDGSYLSTLSTYHMRRKNESQTVRVIEYCLPNIQGKENIVYRLATTILDEKIAPAEKLAQLYHQR